jgi:anti-sigma factor RsiW
MMHEVIQNGLEEYLSGAVRRDFQAHLEQCDGCRREVMEFSAISGAFSVFKEDAAPEAEAPLAAPGFYYRLSQNLEARKAASPWSIFSVNAAFGRRVAFGSLMTLAVLGGLLVSREADFGGPEQAAPEAIMALHDGMVPHEPGSDRDRMMLTLATYQR